MNRISATFCLIAALVSVTSAQNPRAPIAGRAVLPAAANVAESDEPLPENYILSLTVTDKGRQVNELSIVVATAQFTAAAIDPAETISGTLTVQEDGTVLIRYSLSAQIAVSSQNGQIVTPENPATSVQYRNHSVRSSVRLRAGEPVVILKDGTHTYQLALHKLADGVKKDK